MESRFEIITGIPYEVQCKLNNLANEGFFVKVISTTSMGATKLAVTCFIKPDTKLPKTKEDK